MLESQGLLDAHMLNMRTANPDHGCDICDENFMNNFDLVKHVSEEHDAKKKPEEWNCNNCSFQGTCISELMKHLKLTGHQPSQGKLDRRDSPTNHTYQRKNWK